MSTDSDLEQLQQAIEEEMMKKLESSPPIPYSDAMFVMHGAIEGGYNNWVESLPKDHPYYGVAEL